MTLITKPMLAEAITDPRALQYPVLATYKVDGVRMLKVNGEMKSRSLKPIRNKVISKALSDLLPEGADGEILVGQNFQLTTSVVMSNVTKDTFPRETKFYWFDWVGTSLQTPYHQRIENMRNYVKEHADKLENAGIAIIPLYPERIESPEELGLFEQRAIDDGFEGIIVRSPNSPYKCGRSTIKQAWMLKVKQFVDDEAEIIGFDELMHNENKAFADERGYMKRSQVKEGLVPGNTLASFRVRSKNGIEFNIGTGFSADERKRLWDTRNHHIGKLVKYKYFPIGVKDAPRHPVFLGFRDKDDM